MSLPLLRRVELAAPLRWPDAPQLVLSVLLVSEILALTVRFDTQSLHEIRSFWAQLVDKSPQLLQLALVSGIATVVLGRKRFAATLTATSSWQVTSAWRGAALCAHFATLALFALVTAQIVGLPGVTGGFTTLSQPAAWVLLWLGSGAATLVAWCLAVFPARRWRALITEGRTAIALGAAVGGVVWAGSFATEALWQPMARYTFVVVRSLLRLMYPVVITDPLNLRIGTPTFTVTINPACSGYEGIGLILAFLSAYLWLCRRELRFPAALTLLPLGALTMWVANALRITALVAIGHAGFPAVAIGGFHSQAGWLAFNVVGLGFVALTQRAGAFRSDSWSPRAASSAGALATALLGPFIAMLGVGMLTAMVSAGFDWWYPVRVAAVAIVLWVCRRQYADVRWSLSWWAIGVGFVTFLVWVALVPAGGTAKDAWPATLQSVSWYWAALWMLFRTVGYVLTAPLAEELAFRGFLTRRLVSADFDGVRVGTFTWVSFLGSSLVFGVFHGQLWLAGTLAGMAFSLALYKRRALGDAVLAHMTTNGLLAVYALVTGHWSVWS